MKPSDTGRPERPEPPFDLTHKMQRLALDLAWRAYGHDDEYRERLTTWLCEHGLEVWRLLEAERDTAAPASPAVLEGESMRCVHCDGPRPVYCRECYQTFYAFYARHRGLSARPASPAPERAALVELRQAVRFVLDTFECDESQGYRSRDRQFAINILAPALSESQEPVAPERAALVERLERIITKNTNGGAAILLAEDVKALREAAALLKGEQGDECSKKITPHDAAHLALTRKTDTP